MRFVRGWTDPPASIDVESLGDAVANDAVEVAVLFGSYSSDDAGPMSDLDVGILFGPDVGHAERGHLMDELTVVIEETTGVEAVDLVDLAAVGPELGYEALSRGVLVYGERGEATNLEAKLLLRMLDFEPIKRTWQTALDGRLREGTFGRL